MSKATTIIGMFALSAIFSINSICGKALPHPADEAVVKNSTGNPVKKVQTVETNSYMQFRNSVLLIHF